MIPTRLTSRKCCGAAEYVKEERVDRKLKVIPPGGRHRRARRELMLGKFSGGQLTHPGLAGLPTVSTLHPWSRLSPGAGSTHSLVDDATGNLGQLALLGLTDRPEVFERVLGAASGAAADDADRLVDHRPDEQRGLEPVGERQRLGENSGVVHGYRGGFGEQFSEFAGVAVESILVAGVHADGADHMIADQQGQGQHAVNAQPSRAGTEPGPLPLTPKDPEYTGCRCSAAVMQGPSPRVTYWMRSICSTSSALAADASTPMSGG